MNVFLNVKIVFLLLLISVVVSITTAFFMPISSSTVYLVYDGVFRTLGIYFIWMLFSYVNSMKGVKLSKLALVVIVVVLMYSWMNTYMSKLEGNGSTTNGDLLLESMIQGSLILAHIVIAIQLIKNECVDLSKVYLKIIGYSYCLMYLLRFTMSIFFIQHTFVSTYFDNIFTLISTLPYCAMALFYYHESRVIDEAKNEIYK
jgi:hypothetical protein